MLTYGLCNWPGYEAGTSKTDLSTTEAISNDQKAR